VHKSGSRFDPEKAKWFNHQYLQRKSNKEIAMEFREILRAKGFHHDMVDLEKLVGLVKERVSFVKEIWNETDFFFSSPETYDKDVIMKKWSNDTPQKMIELRLLLESIGEFTPEGTEQAVKSWIEAKGYNTGAVMNAFRLLVVGASRGPHMFDIISWIGKQETLKRIDKGLAVIGKKAE
jgi:glutamyl-tRNA synthetase